MNEDEGKVKDETTAVVKDKEIPTDDDKVKDETTQDDDPASGDLDGQDDDDIKDQAAASAERIQDFLDKHGYDSLEEFEAEFDDVRGLQEIVGDKETAEKLLEDAEYLAKVKEYWKEQDEAKKREEESLEETIDRLEQEKKDLAKKIKDRDKAEAKKAEAKKAKAENEKLIKSFNTTVNSELDKAKDIPNKYKPFFKRVLAIDNPMLDVDIASKPEIRTTTKSVIKECNDFIQLVIKDYLDGKIELPKMTAEGASTTPVATEKKIKTLKEARSALFEAFGVKK